MIDKKAKWMIRGGGAFEHRRPFLSKGGTTRYDANDCIRVANNASATLEAV
jgi:hypothetical protein